MAPSKKRAITENPASPLFIHKALPIFTDSRALNYEENNRRNNKLGNAKIEHFEENKE